MLLGLVPDRRRERLSLRELDPRYSSARARASCVIRQHHGSTHTSGGDNSGDLSLYLANVIHVAAGNSLVAGTPSGYY